uniref:Putative sodium/chloride dependent transporter n=1 Tax=Corethrella appendiculata TaxID=1370023 RepID=U5EQ05_9DIPT
MIFITSLISIIIYVYTSTRMIRRHPNYTVCLAGLVVSIAGLLCPNYIVSRILDSRLVGTFIICAMIFEIISIIWIYGPKNLYTDLEFSFGRPVLKLWLVIWSIIPVILVGLLVWWSINYYDSNLLLIQYIPKWVPIVISLAIILILACIEISKQVDYNLCSMIHGATKPSKDWGPGDPLVRHAWKQWKSVCEDTGERDFTLRRRGTKDYTNSIKKGQYSHSNKYGTNNRNNLSTTTGSNSPNYSGSVFGDSAIEEDISVDKFPQFKPHNGDYHQHHHHHNNHLHHNSHPNGDLLTNDKSPRISNSSSSRKSSSRNGDKRTPSERSQAGLINNSRKTSENSYTSRIEIMPEETPYRATSIVRNPLAKVDPNPNYCATDNLNREIYVSNQMNNGDHICWRKFKQHSDEYSTEL